MKLVTSFALLVFSQMNLISAAVEEQAPAAPAKAENTPSDNINYNDVIPTVEKRFKLVMKLMKGESFKPELLEKAKDEINKVSTQFLSKFTPFLTGSGEGSQAASNQSEKPVPSWIKKVKGSKTVTDQAKAVADALTETAKGFHKVFQGLFGEYSAKLQGEPVKPETAEASEKVPSSSTALTGTTLSTEPAATKNDQNDEDFLNLRFVIPAIAKDMDTLYSLIKEKNASKQEEKEALLEVIKKWLNDNVPSVEPKKDMDFPTVEEALRKINDDGHLRDIALSLDAFNQLDDKLADSIQECKKINSASFGTMGLLLAAVIAFTMW